MRALMGQVRKIAKTNVNVLITGESGTGKEILARAIHDFSDRAQKPFVPFNCAAIPRDLLESQLFGHRRGAFTGADRDQLGPHPHRQGRHAVPRRNRRARARPAAEAAPLPRVRRNRPARRAGAHDRQRPHRRRHQHQPRRRGARRPVPRGPLLPPERRPPDRSCPLRERRDEIPGLVNHFVARAAEEFKKGRLGVAEETMERLILYRWPGNVRQLQNEMRRMVALAEPNSTLTPDVISDQILDALPFARPARGQRPRNRRAAPRASCCRRSPASRAR